LLGFSIKRLRWTEYLAGGSGGTRSREEWGNKEWVKNFGGETSWKVVLIR